MSSRKLTTYNRFFAKHRKQGKTPKQIGRLWKSGKGKGKTTTKQRATNPKRNTRMGNNKGKMFRTLGPAGAVEDFAWGFIGLSLMGRNNPAALPTVRLIQAVQGHVFDRVGKGRLVYALIDIADLILVGAASMSSIFDSARQLTKVTQLV
ncbi:unnamed protein product [marine sediment metagenome]|uniref:Uncharacterized protein n=1 Tax=marine sediment metagenome TaxID=412755 RepID=X1MBI0_9ZZZZ